jgi:hypothetical protein
MKIFFAKIVSVLFLAVHFASPSFAQIGSFFRGHQADDLYLLCPSKSGGNNELFRFTSGGSVLSKRSNTNNTCLALLADKTPGKLVGHTSTTILASNDYGNTFSYLAPYPNPNNHVIQQYLFLGGEMPDEYYMVFKDFSILYPLRGVIYYTTDNFFSYHLITDSIYVPYRGDVGAVAGEYYLLSEPNVINYLYHSFDYGATFDTLSIGYQYYNNLGRGTLAGEVYDANIATNPSGGYNCSVRRSTDFGHTWNAQGVQPIGSNIYKVTAGRSPCSYYIAALVPTTGSEYYTLNLYSSNDCGQTFSHYSYLLTPDVGIKDEEKSGFNVSPNPASGLVSLTYALEKAGNITIGIYSMEGKLLDKINTEQQKPGSNTIEYNCYKLRSGFYQVVLTSENGIKKTGKLVIAR